MGALLATACVARVAAAQPLAAGPPGPEALPAEQLLTVESGLSGTAAVAVARASGGPLWIGTQHALDRWDGVRLRTYSEGDGLAKTTLRAIWPDARDGAWLGTTDGLVHLSGADERARPLRFASAHPAAAAPVRVLSAGGGRLWVGTEGHGLYRLVAHGAAPHAGRARGGRPAAAALRLERVRFPVGVGGQPFVPDTLLTVLALAGQPDVALVGSRRGLVRVDVAARRAVRLLDGPIVRCAGAGAPGQTVWCATPGGDVYALSAEGLRPTLLARTGLPVSALEVSASREGTLWVGTRGQGLHALDTRSGALRPVATALAALARADVMALREDDEGTLWAGTLVGLFKVYARPPLLASLTAAHGLSVSSVLAIHQGASSPDVLWLGTMRGGLHRYDRRSGAMTHFFDAPGHRLSVLFALLEDTRRQLWLGSTGGEIHRFERETGHYTSVPLTPHPEAVVYTLYEAPSLPGVVWAGTQAAGLFAYDADRERMVATFGPNEAPPRRLAAESVWQVLEAPSEPGVLWVATSGDGLHRLDTRAAATARVALPATCLAGDDVFSVDAAPDGSLWLGVGAQLLVRYDPASGTCAAFPPVSGAADARRVFVAADGRVWVSTRTAGLLRLDPATGTYARFGRPDGVEGGAFFIPAGFRGTRGELYFGGLHGVTAVQPLGAEPGAPARTVLTRVLLEDRPVPTTGARPLRLPAHRHDLTFEFAALSLRQPQLNQYRVRLEGADDTWRTLHGAPQVRYPFLAPGHYVFHVAGAGASGLWGEQTASFAFVIRPPFWRTPYFWMLVALAVGMMIVGGYQYRLRAMQRVEHTRRRIADDLHDDIGSKVSTVALRLDLARRTMPLGEAEQRRLGDLAGAMREVVSELRDIVWLVDSGFDSLDAVVSRMEQAAEQMLGLRPGTFERPASLPRVALSMEQRRHLFLFFREAFCNAAKHTSGPVHVSVTAGEGRLRLRVTDEGPGFNVSHRSSGRGLSTLEMRARAQGAAYAIDSHPSRGTTVTLDVPIAGLRAPAGPPVQVAHASADVPPPAGPLPPADPSPAGPSPSDAPPWAPGLARSTGSAQDEDGPEAVAVHTTNRAIPDPVNT